MEEIRTCFVARQKVNQVAAFWRAWKALYGAVMKNRRSMVLGVGRGQLGARLNIPHCFCCSLGVEYMTVTFLANDMA